MRCRNHARLLIALLATALVFSVFAGLLVPPILKLAAVRERRLGPHPS